MRCFRSLEYIFKFIIQSRLLFARATGGQNEDSFRVDVDSLVDSFARMLSMNLDNIEASQVSFVNEFIHFTILMFVFELYQKTIIFININLVKGKCIFSITNMLQENIML